MNDTNCMTSAESKNYFTGETECWIRGARYIVEERQTIADLAARGLVHTVVDWAKRGISAQLTVRRPRGSQVRGAYVFKSGQVVLL